LVVGSIPTRPTKFACAPVCSVARKSDEYCKNGLILRLSRA
jgi:hypothetical protein